MQSNDVSLIRTTRAVARSKFSRKKLKFDLIESSKDEDLKDIHSAFHMLPAELGPGFISFDQIKMWLGNIGDTTVYALMKIPNTPLPRPVHLRGRAVFPVDLIAAWRAAFVQDQLTRQGRGASKTLATRPKPSAP